MLSSALLITLLQPKLACDSHVTKKIQNLIRISQLYTIIMLGSTNNRFSLHMTVM